MDKKKSANIVILIISHWLFQGVFHRGKKEKLIRLVFESIGVILLSAIFSLFFKPYISLLFSFFLCHSIFFVTDGYIWAVLRVKKWNKIRFTEYVEDIKYRSQHKKYLKAIAAFGSFSRLKSNEFSDLDLIVIPQEGIVNFILSYAFALKKRFKSFISGFPLDLFILDNIDYKLKNKEDISPVIIYDPFNYIRDRFAHSISFSEIRSRNK